MVKKNINLGAISFLGLTVLAIISGIGMPANLTGISLVLMGLLGIIAGIINITTKEIVPFLLAIITLMVGGTGIALISFFDVISLGATINAIVGNLVVAYGVMGVVVAFKTVFTLGPKK